MPQLVQLRTGQFLIGSCKTGDDGSVQITDPFEVVIEPVQTPDGVMPRAGMFPYAMMAKSRTFNFNKEQVQLAPCEPDDNCANNWAKATNNITIAKSTNTSNLILHG